MREAIFVQLYNIPPIQRPESLRSILRHHRDTGATLAPTYSVEPARFQQIPTAPFGYWMDTGVRRLYESLPTLGGDAGTVKQGLATADDFRFVRTVWEVQPDSIAGSAGGDPSADFVWFVKAGSYSPYHADVHLVVKWRNHGAEIKNRINPSAGRPYSNVWMLAQTERELFFQPGLTWAYRTRRLGPAPLPQGCIFSHKSNAFFPIRSESLPLFLGLLASQPFFGLLRVFLGSTQAPTMEVGTIQRVPVPEGSIPSRVVQLVDEAVGLRRSASIVDETSMLFVAPSLLSRTSFREERIASAGSTLSELEWDVEQRVSALQEEIDASIVQLYGINEKDQWQLRAPASAVSTHDDLIEENNFEDSDGDDDEEDEHADSSSEDLSVRIANLLMWSVGVILGRWDVRLVRDHSLIPELQGPFERLPRVAPGGLVGPDGLPATPQRIASEAWLRARPDVITLPEPSSVEGPDHITASDYPIEVAWDGILVDDPGHPRDIMAKVHEVLTYVYGSAERAQEIEAEALEILQAGGRTPKSLRDWFRNQKASELSKNFFDFHIQRYSKSRRKAPIYWRLTSNPGRGQAEYSVWLYYHRLTGDTLWQVLTQYVGPKRALEQRRLDDLREARGSAQGAEKSRIEKEIEGKVALLEELDWFESRLRTVAERGYRPNLDDGVIINMAPLHELVPWKEPEKVWKKLEKGEYDWAHLAMQYWPQRVREKCREDKSLAIAHGVKHP